MLLLLSFYSRSSYQLYSSTQLYAMLHSLIQQFCSTHGLSLDLKQINMKRGESKTAIHEASEVETSEQCCHNIRTLETEQSRLSDTTRPGH